MVHRNAHAAFGTVRKREFAKLWFAVLHKDTVRFAQRCVQLRWLAVWNVDVPHAVRLAWKVERMFHCTSLRAPIYTEVTFSESALKKQMSPKTPAAMLCPLELHAEIYRLYIDQYRAAMWLLIKSLDAQFRNSFWGSFFRCDIWIIQSQFHVTRKSWTIWDISLTPFQKQTHSLGFTGNIRLCC